MSKPKKHEENWKVALKDIISGAACGSNMLEFVRCSQERQEELRKRLRCVSCTMHCSQYRVRRVIRWTLSKCACRRRTRRIRNSAA